MNNCFKNNLDDIEKTEDFNYITHPFNEDEVSNNTQFTTSLEYVDLSSNYINIEPGYNIFSNFYNFYSEIKDDNKKKKLHEFILIFSNIISSHKNVIDNDLYLPKLSFSSAEDKSLLIEWIFKNFRIGFSFEEDENESSWYVVSDKTLNDFSISGDLNFDNLESLLISILLYVIANG